jgi:DNA invertase Pin-like site-specific DNA recombinase
MNPKLLSEVQPMSKSATRDVVAYYRVSTRLQGTHGLGMAAQREAVRLYAERNGYPNKASYEEVETGRRDFLRNRPALVAAVAHARRSGSLLVIARIDRLARSVLVTSQLLASGVEFVACDNPHANRMTIQILAVMAEHESRMISERTRAANAAARARGVDFRRPQNRISPEVQRLGTAAANREAIARSAHVYRDLVPIIARLRASGASLLDVARTLNSMGHRTQRGSPWSGGNVYVLLRREGMTTQPPAWWVGTSERRRTQAATTAARYAPLLVEIAERRTAGETLSAIAEGFNARGLRTFRGRPWNQSGLINLLQRQGGVDRDAILRGSARAVC